MYRFRGDVQAFLYRDANTFDTLYLIRVCLISIGVVSTFDELRPDEIATMLFERIRSSPFKIMNVRNTGGNK